MVLKTVSKAARMVLQGELVEREADCPRSCWFEWLDPDPHGAAPIMLVVEGIIGMGDDTRTETTHIVLVTKIVL